MNSHISRKIRHAATKACLFLSMILSPMSLTAREELIKSADQLSSNQPDGLAYLIDKNVDTSWTSQTGNNLQNDQYIIVKLNEDLELNDNECIVVYTQRHKIDEGPSPTTFRIEVSESDSDEDWKTWAHAYLLYRGKSSKEYSARLTKQSDNTFTKIKRLKFTVTANNTRVRNTNTGARAMTMAEFQIFKLGKTEPYDSSIGLIDRLHLKTDYSLNYWDWTYEHTQGIVNSANAIPNWIGYNNNGTWSQDKDFLEKNEIEMPDMSFIILDKSQQRQRTHVTEHELYAIPGDAIALYPYYQLAGSDNYYENFSHWYDYNNGGRITGTNAVGNDFELLDFLIDPSRIIKGNNFGYIGGKSMKGIKRNYQNTPAVEVNTPGKYVAFVNRVNQGEAYLNMNIVADLDFTGVNNIPMLGSSSRPYHGTINGNGHTIKNMNITHTDTDGVGLVAYGGEGLHVRDLIIDSSCHFTGMERVALVAMTNPGNGVIRFSNVAVLATIEATGREEDKDKDITAVEAINAAGFQACHISGDGSYQFENCYFGGIVIGARDCAAFSGWLGGNGNHQFHNCYSNGTISGNGNWSNTLAITNYNGVGLSKMFSNCYSNQDKDLTAGVIAEKIEDGFKLNDFKGKPNIINVYTVDEYLQFVNRVNSGETSLVMYINADLDFMGSTNVQPIGTEEHPFIGKIYGNKHTISNLKIEKPDSDHVGMIGYAGEGFYISDLTFDQNCNFEGSSYVGIVGVTNHSSGSVVFENIRMYGSCTASGTYPNGINAGGIHGCAFGSGAVIFRNCYSGGTVTGNRESAAISGWIGTNANSRIINCISTANVRGKDGDNELARMDSKLNPGSVYINCYATQPKAEWGIGQIPEGINKDNISDFEDTIYDSEQIDLRQSDGAVATFFYPRNPYEGEGILKPLPLPDGQTEYVIAADFSQTFDASKNMNNDGKNFIEPIIAFRHIFRIKDGVTFAEEFSGSKENNEEYVRKHMHHVTARAGKPFQIRFDSPIPAEGTTRSKYYYKISNTDYRRVCTMDIVVMDADTRKVVTDMPFKKDGIFKGQGTRSIDGITYQICGGGCTYYRMLKCDDPKPGRYIVQLIGKDINGHRIKICDNSGADLIVMEYMITFLPETGASFITEETLAQEQYRHHRSEYLEEQFGTPAAVVNFDNYRHLVDIANKELYLKEVTACASGSDATCTSGDNAAYYFKWPAAWDKSTYAFGYNSRRDYNMYMITNSSKTTPYHSGVHANNQNHLLYDRLYYDTNKEGYEGKPERGFFYYVNASTDPGVMARLRINDLCLGSTLYVSAWVAEFSQTTEKANVSFNFIAVLKDDKGGTRVPLHSFITGYVPDNDHCGKWMHVYYSFIPSYGDTGISSEDVDHYELELDNNCTSSNGADYAIDDIRVYVARPNVYATQLTEVCDENTNNVTIRLEASFQMLLETLGLEEASVESNQKDIELFYTVFDKKKFDSLYQKEQANGEDAYNNSVLTYNYDGNGEKTYGKITFKTFYQNNPDYIEEAEIGKAYRMTDNATNERLIVFHTIPVNENVSKGGEYTVVFYTRDPINTSAGGSSGEWYPKYQDYDPLGDCAKKANFRIKTSGIIKIDGMIVQDADQIRVCENMSPVVQINLYGKTGDGSIGEIEKNAYFDWFDGSFDDYKKVFVTKQDGTPVKYDEKDENGNTTVKDMPLSYALAQFRASYPNATVCNETETPAINSFTNDMGWFINRLTTEIPESKERPRLLLHQSSYVFPPLKAGDGASDEGKDYYVLAIPFDYFVEEKNVTICAVPTEVKINAVKQSPLIMHGIKGINYPISSVPLRIGLDHLDKVSKGKASGSAPNKYLDIPIRVVESTNNEITQMTWYVDKDNQADKSIYLVETNDPGYKDLGTIEPDGDEKGYLTAIGELKEFSAKVTTENATGTDDNKYRLAFYDDFRFKEGYYYTLRFNFKEEGTAGGPDADSSSSTGEEEAVECVGHDLIIIKVVPEYQMWTGKESLNFNDDNNWRRVTSDELLRGQSDTDRFTTDGANGNKFSYAPLDFTKAIIPAGEKYPHLYDPLTNDPTNFSSTITGYAGTAGTEVKWSASPNPTDTDNSSEEIGNVTTNVQYDMVAYIPTGEQSDVKCRTWYANVCEQIHFLRNAEIMNQQHLLYGKAWVDMEMEPHRWYLASSPLQDVVAGDMYLPTNGARQLTERFKPINFVKGTNDRFAPAVFQRGWDKGSATVYKLPSDSPAETENVAVSLDWSHVYNDVQEKYSGGMGYSIKTDVSKATNFDAKATGYDYETPGSVLFRLPKEDKAYEYWDQSGSNNGQENGGNVSRNNNGKLNPVTLSQTLTNANGSLYFLAGNPFMAHLDMKEFFEANKDVIEPKYWIMTAGSQQCAIFDENSDGFVSTIEGDASVVAPLQGFFVQAKSSTLAESQITLNFKPEMITVRPFDVSNGNLFRSMTRSAETVDGMRISVSDVEGETFTSALVRTSSDAANDCRENEDVLLLDDPDSDVAKVFTIAGNKASAINTLNNPEGLEIGILAPEGKVSRMVFENTGEYEYLSLLDTSTGEATELYDGLEVEVKGSATGRFFLTTRSGTPETELLGLRVETNGHEVTVYAPAAHTGLDVSAYNISGMVVRNVICNGSATMTLDSGIYIITATASDGSSTRRKIIIR